MQSNKSMLRSNMNLQFTVDGCAYCSFVATNYIKNGDKSIG